MTYEKERSAFFNAFDKINHIGRFMTRIGAGLDKNEDTSLLDLLLSKEKNVTDRKYIKEFNLATIEKEYFTKTFYEIKATRHYSPNNTYTFYEKWDTLEDIDVYKSLGCDIKIIKEKEIKIFRYVYNWNDEAIAEFENAVKWIASM